ncbi:TPA: hypothetical protein ACJIKV_004672 [Citrobacter freundii]
MIRIMIRIFSLTFVACAGFAAYHFNSVPLMLTSGGFLLTFLGTFIVNKTSSGHTIIQKSGSHSKNNQTVVFGNNENKRG